MSDFMKSMGIASVEEWEMRAQGRRSNLTEESLRKLSEMGSRMLSIMHLDSFEADTALMEDEELLVSGKMSFDEHRAYLREKYKKH